MRFTPHKSSPPQASAAPLIDSQATNGPGLAISSDERPPCHSPDCGETDAAASVVDTSSRAAETEGAAVPSYSTGGGSGTGNGLADVEGNSRGNPKEERGAKGNSNQQECSVVLMPRSLLVFKDEAYTGELVLQTHSRLIVPPRPPSGTADLGANQ